MEEELTFAFQEMRSWFNAQTKKEFLSYIEGEFLDNSEMMENVMERSNSSSKYLAVTFDRRFNDADFSYQYFDLILVALDRICGGTGIMKPNKQLRVLKWNGSRVLLRDTIRSICRGHTRVRYQRLLVLPFPDPVVGIRVDATRFLK